MKIFKTTFGKTGIIKVIGLLIILFVVAAIFFPTYRQGVIVGSVSGIITMLILAYMQIASVAIDEKHLVCRNLYHGVWKEVPTENIPVVESLHKQRVKISHTKGWFIVEPVDKAQFIHEVQRYCPTCTVKQ